MLIFFKLFKRLRKKRIICGRKRCQKFPRRFSGSHLKIFAHATFFICGRCLYMTTFIQKKKSWRYFWNLPKVWDFSIFSQLLISMIKIDPPKIQERGVLGQSPLKKFICKLNRLAASRILKRCFTKAGMLFMEPEFSSLCLLLSGIFQGLTHSLKLTLLFWRIWFLIPYGFPLFLMSAHIRQRGSKNTRILSI